MECWAVAFSRCVEKVWIWDASASNLAAGKHAIAQALRLLQDSGSIVSADEALGRIHAAASLQEAVTQSDYIQESVSEELQLKRLAAIKQSRDDDTVRRSLAVITDQACDASINLMPAIIDAVRAYATEGEIINALATEFGRWDERATV